MNKYYLLFEIGPSCANCCDLHLKMGKKKFTP